jgi:Fe-S cluster assembly protein SufD
MNTDALAEMAEKKMALTNGGIKDFRETHLALFKKKGLTSFDVNSYKYTNLSSFFEGLTYTPYEPEDSQLEKYNDERFTNLIFVDGVLQGHKVKVPGLSLSNLEESFAILYPDLRETHGISHLHHSLLSSGIVVEVAKNTTLDKPLRILNLITRSGLNATTVFIKMNANSNAAIIEENTDQSISHGLINETYLQVHQGASLEHVQMTHTGATGLTHSSTYAYVNKDATYRNVILNLSGKTSGTEHSDLNTCIEHQAADTTSNQIAKGILADDSKGIFTGKIHIHQHAQRVAAGQLNKNLLLSKKAQVFSEPQLEIFADDVKCSHGSTTGQLSDDEVFYFETRGIPAEKARTLLAQAYGLEIVLKIQNKMIKEKAQELVVQALKTKFQLGGQNEHP